MPYAWYKALQRTALEAWTTKFTAFMNASLPKATPWGRGRLDAFGMIFNRLSGLDLHQPANVVLADAPVSYPFPLGRPQAGCHPMGWRGPQRA